MTDGPGDGSPSPPPPPPPSPPWGGYPHHAQPYPTTPKHPQATTALVLGVVGIAACGLVAPFAWVIGAKAVKEIDAGGGAVGGRSEANAGKIMGIVGTALIALGIIAFIVLLVVAFSTAAFDEPTHHDDYYDHVLSGTLGQSSQPTSTGSLTSTTP